MTDRRETKESNVTTPRRAKFTPAQRQSLIATAERQVEERALVGAAMRVELAHMYPGRSTSEAYALVAQSSAAREQLVAGIEQRVNGVEGPHTAPR